MEALLEAGSQWDDTGYTDSVGDKSRLLNTLFFLLFLSYFSQELWDYFMYNEAVKALGIAAGRQKKKSQTIDCGGALEPNTEQV